MAFLTYQFVADGTVNGVVTIDSTQYFKVEQWVIIAAIGNPTLTLEVKKILSSTQLAVGPITLLERDDIRTDISAYTVLAAASIIQRNVFLDASGNLVTATDILDKRCLDVNVASGEVTILNPSINTHIDAEDTPPDSVRAYGITGTSAQKQVLVDANGKIIIADPAHISPTAIQMAVYGGNLIYNIDKTTTANMVYIGVAVPGSLEANASWKIMRIDKTTSPMRIRMAGGDENFDKIWNNRVGLTYT